MFVEERQSEAGEFMLQVVKAGFSRVIDQPQQNFSAEPWKSGLVEHEVVVGWNLKVPVDAISSLINVIGIVVDYRNLILWDFWGSFDVYNN